MTVAHRFTSADLEALPDTEGVRYEIIDGELYVSRTPHVAHQYACSQLIYAFEDWNQKTGAGIAVAASGLIFSPDNDVIPDVVWISHARFAQVLDEKGHFRAAPELVIEVLSPGPVNEIRDRELKLDLYSRQGVNEYWIVDWRAREVHVYRREQDALRLAASLRGQDVLTSPQLPGFSWPLPRLWLPEAER